MNPLSQFFGTGVGIFVLIVLILQAVLWFFIPFMIWGISKRFKLLMNYYLEKNGVKLDWGDRIVPLELGREDKEKRTREAAQRISGRTLYDEGA